MLPLPGKVARKGARNRLTEAKYIHTKLAAGRPIDLAIRSLHTPERHQVYRHIAHMAQPLLECPALHENGQNQSTVASSESRPVRNGETKIHIFGLPNRRCHAHNTYAGRARMPR